MKTNFPWLLALGLLGLAAPAAAQVGIGTTSPDSKAALDIRATDKGLLIPRLTQAQRLAIAAPPQGLMVYQTDGTASGGAQTGFWYYTGTGGWVFLDAAASGGFTLPYGGTTSSLGTAFQVSNTGLGSAILGQAAGTLPAISGTHSGGGAGVSGSSASGSGVVASSTTGTALSVSKGGSQTGRLALFTNTNAGNDSTGVLVSTVGLRPALKGVDQSGYGAGAGVMGLTRRGFGVRGVAAASGGYGVSGESPDAVGVVGTSPSGLGVQGSSSTNFGVEGRSDSQSGVYGYTAANANTVAGVRGLADGGNQAVGVLGQTTNGYGVRGVASANGGYGVEGEAVNSFGVRGASGSGVGVFGRSTSGVAVQGQKSGAEVGRVADFTNTNANNDSTAVSLYSAGDRPTLRVVNAAASGQAAVRGVKLSGSDASAVEGVIGGGVSGNAAGVLGRDQTGSSTGAGVIGTTTGGYGVRGVASASGGYGVSGTATDSYGVIGSSQSGTGVYGSSNSSYGVQGTTNASAANSTAGVLGTGGTNNTGVLGQGFTGVRGESTAALGLGVYGRSSGSGGIGLYGEATSGTGLSVVASGQGRAAYLSQTNSGYTGDAVEIRSAGTGTGLHVEQTSGKAAYLRGDSAEPVMEVANAGAGAVMRLSSALGGATSLKFNYFSSDVGEIGATSLFGTPSLSLRVKSSTNSLLTIGLLLSGSGTHQMLQNWNAQGNLSVTGNFSVSGTKAFKIDHPLDPANKYLTHSCVESPDVLSVYNGNATLDARGEAVVQLPAYFEALNRDFRYQLTPLGAPGPGLYVAEEVRANHFRIAGGTPGGRVSWQVTGIRHDKSAEAHPLVPETAKEPENRGRYLSPEAYGLPRERGIGYVAPALAEAPAAATSAPVAKAAKAPTVHRSAAPGQLNDAAPRSAQPFAPARHD